MHLSAQEEYGLRCLLQVARHDQSGEPLGIAEIATGEGLSPEYAAKLLRSLRKGGLLVSTLGASGGYRLARPAAQISVWQAIEVLGGPLFSEHFCESHAGHRKDCVHTNACSVRSVWQWLGGAVRGALEGISLADLSRPESLMSEHLAHTPIPSLRLARSTP